MTWKPHNIREAPLHVLHSELKRYDDGDFKSVCPKCGKGLLLVSRNQKTFQLTRLDRCTLCGQLFIYEDETIGREAVEPIAPEVLEKLKLMHGPGS